MGSLLIHFRKETHNIEVKSSDELINETESAQDCTPILSEIVKFQPPTIINTTLAQLILWPPNITTRSFGKQPKSPKPWVT